MNHRLAVVLSAHLLLGAIVLTPLLLVDIPGLVDYPDQLARLWLQEQDAPASAETTNYILRWRLIPNMAMELLLPVLMHSMALESAGRVFIGMAMLLPVLATVGLQRALFGSVSPWSLASWLFVYHLVLYWGFLNYQFSMGVALLTFSAWVAIRHVGLLWRSLLFTPIATALFILHLFAFGLYGLLIAAYELGLILGRERRTPRAVIASMLCLMQFIPACIVWAATWSNAGPTYIAYGDIYQKLYALQAPMAFGTLGAKTAILCLSLTYLAWRTRILTVAPAMRLPILTVIAAAILMPAWMLGSWGADMRLPVALPFLLIASSTLHIAHPTLRASLAALAALFLLVRVGSLSANWMDLDKKFAEFRAASEILPRGARLLVVQSPIPDDTRRIGFIPSFITHREGRDFHHMSSLAVIDRDAFIPFLFTGWTMILPGSRNEGRFAANDDPLTPEELHLTATPDWRRYHAARPDKYFGKIAYWLDWPEKFEFLLWVDFGQQPAFIPANLTLIETGSFFRLYRIAPP